MRLSPVGAHNTNYRGNAGGMHHAQDTTSNEKKRLIFCRWVSCYVYRYFGPAVHLDSLAIIPVGMDFSAYSVCAEYSCFLLVLVFAKPQQQYDCALGMDAGFRARYRVAVFGCTRIVFYDQS